MFAAEDEKLSERGGAIGGLLNGFGLSAQRITDHQLIEQNLGVTADHGEQIIEIVSDASGKAADSFHFLRLTELVFEDAAFGNVFGDGLENVGRLNFTGDGATADANRNGGAIFSFPANLESIDARNQSGRGLKSG